MRVAIFAALALVACQQTQAPLYGPGRDDGDDDDTTQTAPKPKGSTSASPSTPSAPADPATPANLDPNGFTLKVAPMLDADQRSRLAREIEHMPDQFRGGRSGRGGGPSGYGSGRGGPPRDGPPPLDGRPPSQ